MENRKEVIGGYNPIEWKNSDYSGNSYGVTNDSFIFSFKGSDDIKGYILSRVKDESCATINLSSYGPTFGITDLELMNEYGACREFTYEKRIIETSNVFTMIEYEVFQITK
ncbi:hypothetical protein GLOIN_2v1499475 [Rhizophagus clarus]|nr:hypothetical protein GLOIN_2v1499475 [Rhizophagus clarus]